MGYSGNAEEERGIAEDNRKVSKILRIKELEKIESEIIKENIERFGKKQYWRETLKIYKPLLDSIKKEKQKQKAEGTYDLVTITDRFTGKEVKIHIGINCIDRIMKKGKRYLLKKILYKKIMFGKELKNE